MGLKLKILNLINSKNETIHSGAVEDFARDLGYKASNATRRCRELVRSKLIRPVYDKKGRVSYEPIKCTTPQEPAKELVFGSKKSIHLARRGDTRRSRRG